MKNNSDASKGVSSHIRAQLARGEPAMIMHISSRQALSCIFLRGSVRVVVAVMLFATVQASLWAQDLPNYCGVLRSASGFGPYDYRPSHYIPQSTHKSHEALLNIVERAHFTPAVEANLRGKTGVTSGGDLTYTLHSFPNYHRALLSMVALGTKERTDKPYGVRYTIECYFKRAIAFRPDDRIVRLIYASFLVGKGGATMKPTPNSTRLPRTPTAMRLRTATSV